MIKRPLTSQILRILGFVILIDLIVIFIVAAIGWWAGWQTSKVFHQAIRLAGILVIGIGFLGIKGNWKKVQTNDKYSKSFSSERNWVQPQPTLADFVQSYTFMIVMLLAGGLCLIISWMI